MTPDLIELAACGQGYVTIEPNRQSKVNYIEIDKNPPRMNNVAIIMPDSISPASQSQDFPAEENRVALRARPDRTLNDASGHTTESKMLAHPMRIVANRTENDIPVDLSVNSEDANQASGFSLQFRVPRKEPKRHPNTNRKIKDWNLDIIKPVVTLGNSNLSRIPMFEDPQIQIDRYGR